MKLFKSLLLGSAAALASAASAQATDLPSRGAGPIEYVRTATLWRRLFLYSRHGDLFEDRLAE